MFVHNKSLHPYYRPHNHHNTHESTTAHTNRIYVHALCSRYLIYLKRQSHCILRYENSMEAFLLHHARAPNQSISTVKSGRKLIATHKPRPIGTKPSYYLCCGLFASGGCMEFVDIVCWLFQRDDGSGWHRTGQII